MRRSVCVAAAVAMLVTAGCQKLNENRTLSLEPMDVNKIMISGPTYQQAVKATVEPESAPVSAYLAKDSDVPAVEQALQAGREPDAKLLLAGKTVKPNDAKSDITLEATVPAKTAFTLVVQCGGKATKAKVKIAGK